MKAIFVMFDSMRRDHVEAYGPARARTPNLARFAERAAVINKSFTGSWATVPNRHDLFTARWDFWRRPWAAVAPEDQLLAERLTEAGVPSMYVIDTPHPLKFGFNYSRGFTAWWWNRGQENDSLVLDATIPLEYPCSVDKIRNPDSTYVNIIQNRAHRRDETDWFAPGTINYAIRWLEKNYTRDHFLLWVDCFDPHEPWDPPQHYIDLYDPGYEGEVCDYPVYGRQNFLSEAELKHTRARYAAEVTMCDRWFGLLLEAVEHLGIMDDTLIIVTADHGHYLDYPEDCGLIGKPVRADDEVVPLGLSMIHQPLLIWAPGITQGQRLDVFSSPADLPTTILDWLGVEPAERMQGSSLLPVLTGESQGRDFAVGGCHRLAAWFVTDEWYYLTWYGHRGPRLWKWREDYQLQHDLVQDERDVARELHGRLVEFLRGLGAEGEQVEGLVAPE